MAMSQSILGQRIDGIWHTGIIVYSREYYFGGGIQVAATGQFAASNQLQPTQVLDMGTTTKTQEELGQYLRSINHLFTQNTYNLISNNCNNFADNICNFLTGHGIPNYIVDLPRIVFSTPGGAMLRPMIENMQNNIRQQQGSGLDPFGGGGSAAASNPRQFETALSDSVRSVAMNMARDASQAVATPTAAPVIPVKAKLEEQALVSGDASTVQVIGRKILNLPGPDGTPGSALTEAEREQISSVLAELSSKPLADPNHAECRFSIEVYSLLERVLAEHPAAHMSCLFILRLMLLHDRASEFDKLNIVREILRRLMTHAQSGGTATTEGFASIPAHVLAICSISNLLSHDLGAEYLLHGSKDGKETNTSAVHVSDLIDIVLSGLSHSRAEVRQMSATLAYNYTLLCTKDSQLSGLWKASSADSSVDSVVELNPQAMQLLCGCLEGLIQETDISVRRRRLAVICRIFRAYGSVALQLVSDLGFQDQLTILHSDRDITPPVTKEEKEILAEINHALSAH